MGRIQTEEGFLRERDNEVKMTRYLILIIIGAVFIIEALPLIISPDKMKLYYKKLSETDSTALRTTAFIMIVIGLLIVFFVREKICR